MNLVGYNRETILGRTPSLIKSEAAVKVAEHQLGRILSDDGPDTVTFEIQIQHSNGETVLCEDTMGVLPYEGAEFDGSVGVLRNITEQRQREHRFRTLIEETNDIISVVDADGRFQYLNPSFEHILGYVPADMVGTLAWSLIHPDDRERVKEEFNSWVEEAQSAFDAVEFRVQHIDGSWRWLEAKAKANPEKSGFNGYLITSREITARKERQQQLELFERVLRHNIRNDMSVICGAADTIKTNTTDDTKWFATKILEKSEDMLQMTEKQREITKILRENQEKSECDIRNMLKNLQSKMQSVHPNARITLDCPDEVILDVNERFSHALQELVENAIVHNDSDEPTVEITVSLTEEHVSIAVADDGPRIPDMEREVILNPQNRSPLYHGSGLGLWLIKLLVSRSGGKIGFVKTPQPGNTIKIDIPLSAV